MSLSGIGVELCPHFVKNNLVDGADGLGMNESD